MRSGSNWVWSAYGKHPAAKDYIRIGETFPLLNSFQEWVERGHGAAIAKRNGNSSQYSWRFWAKGLRRDTVVCGLLKDSSDSLGRAFPLLIMGTGPLEDWEKEWDLMPYVCENTWGRMEYLTAQAGGDLSRLQAEIPAIKPPYSDWQRFAKARQEYKTAEKVRYDRGFEVGQENRGGPGSVIANLDSRVFHAQGDPVGCWHFQFRGSVDTVPNAVFVGGTMDKGFIALFRRSLAPDDFIQLWTVGGVRG